MSASHCLGPGAPRGMAAGGGHLEAILTRREEQSVAVVGASRELLDALPQVARLVCRAGVDRSRGERCEG